MADTLMGLEEVAKELQLDKEQVIELVKKGMLRGFMDQKTYKFRSPDVETYKRKLTSSATRLSEEKKDATSKVDLAEIESDAGIEESDQTSVLAPADEAEDHLTAKPEDTPVFQFSEKELGLEDEDGSGVEEADQTSLMMPAEEVKEEAKKEEPALDFDARNLSLEDEHSDEPPIVAEETESSVDILDVADESSSESSASTMDLSDDSGTGEDVMVLTDVEESSSKTMKPVAEPPSKAGAKGKESGATTVSDLLGQAEEGSEEELETLDIEEVVETGEAVAEQPEKVLPDTTDTVPIADEAETVGLGEVAEAAPAEDETKFRVGDAVETAGVSDAVAEALKEATGGEAAEEAEGAAEAADEAGEARVVVPTGWEMVTASPFSNACLIAASVMLIAGSIFVFCESFDIQNGLTQQVVDALKGFSLL